MDNDEKLARLLQEEEDATAAARALAALHVRGSAAAQANFVAQVEGCIQKVAAYEDDLAQAMALSCMDLRALQAAADDAAGLSSALQEQPPLGTEDALAQELLLWFKRSFFSWVDRPPCDQCGGAGTALTATVAPSPEEAQHRAGRTEVYHCFSCPGVTRFPRFNDPVQLLVSRRGRCGEWANCFALCCRAAGLDARLVMDWSDHVWVEYWSQALQRWVHLDPCEAAADSPLLYEGGWGKRLSYCIAVGRDGAADVTRRYTRQWEHALRRRQLSEEWVARYLGAANARLRAPLPAERRRALEQRDAADEAAMAAACSALLTAAEAAALPGRQTGSAEWVAARGEGGADVQAGSAPPGPPAVGGSGKAANAGTRYRRAADEHLLQLRRDRLCGGAVRASGDNPPEECAVQAVDGRRMSKWLDFSGVKRGAAWLEYRLLPPSPPCRIASYALTSANDAPERDPAYWRLEAWDDDLLEWRVLDEQRGMVFAERGQRKEFWIDSKGPASVEATRFRLRVGRAADPRAANSVQMACWDLYSATE